MAALPALDYICNEYSMQEVPNFSWDVSRALARAALFKKDVEKLTLPLNSYFEQTANQEREFAQAATSNVIVLNPVKFLSKAEIIPSSENGFPIYRDVHHLTLHGAILIRPMFLPMFSSNQRIAIESGGTIPTERPEIHSDLDFAHNPY